jgi:hypothetical protein
MAVTENRHRGVNTVIGTNIVPEAHLEGAVARQNQVRAVPVPGAQEIPEILRPDPVRRARETARKNQAAAPMTMAMNPFMTTMIMMKIVIAVTAIMQMVWMMRWMNWIGRITRYKNKPL